MKTIIDIILFTETIICLTAAVHFGMDGAAVAVIVLTALAAAATITLNYSIKTEELNIIDQ